MSLVSRANTTFAQLEVRDLNNSIVKRITLDNSSDDLTPALKLITSDGTKEIRQEIKPHEIKHLFIPRVYQENRGRAGFRRRNPLSVNRTVLVTEPSIVYVPPDKLDDTEKDDLDPDEEFQVDESNHGLYLLNYSDAESITLNPKENKTTLSNEIKENTTFQIESTTLIDYMKENVTKLDENDKEDKPENNVIANSTDIKSTPLVQIDTEKDKNQTLFISDEIYNHFRPLDSELPVEEMAPFIYFGQKLGAQGISDNLTNSPSLSASTKSVNFIAPPPDKRKFNSRYSATEKYKNTSTNEDEINEDMDVSVVKNIIEKNKIRNTVKGPAPARHVGLVSSYRKLSTTTPPATKSLSIVQLNSTEPSASNTTQIYLDKSTEKNKTNTTTNTDLISKFGVNNITRDVQNKVNNSTTLRNVTRNYFNLRRKPSRVSPVFPSTDIPPTLSTNSTTEKIPTTVYTAVVTSVSITSSMKGQNKTEDILKEGGNSTFTASELQEEKNMTTPKAILLNDAETTTSPASTMRPFRHKIRIRTTTTEGSPNLYPTEFPKVSELSTKHLIKNETISRITDRLASLFNQNEHDNTTLISTIRPKTLRRRRPTTTTTLPTNILSDKVVPTIDTSVSSTPQTTAQTEITTVFKPFIITSRTSSESRTKPILLSTNTSQLEAKGNNNSSQNEEVVIEAEKTYTASYVLAGLGFLPVAAIIAFVLRNVFNKKAKELETEYEGYFDEGEIKKESPITPVARPPLPTPTKPDQKWEFPRNKLRLQTLLGQGNFGQVSMFM